MNAKIDSASKTTCVTDNKLSELVWTKINLLPAIKHRSLRLSFMTAYLRHRLIEGNVAKFDAEEICCCGRFG